MLFQVRSPFRKQGRAALPLNFSRQIGRISGRFPSSRGLGSYVCAQDERSEPGRTSSVGKIKWNIGQSDVALTLI